MFLGCEGFGEGKERNGRGRFIVFLVCKERVGIKVWWFRGKRSCRGFKE